MRTLLALGLLVVAASPALAGATPWQVVTPGVQLRLISSDTKAADGTTLVGLELDMPQNYRTYWQIPGETGIATEIDTSGSSGVKAASIDWPYPSPEKMGGFLDYVYHGPTVLPITLTATNASGDLKASVLMGVCSEVCVPVQAKFDLPLTFASADAGQSIRLAQALSLSPIAWSQSAAPFGLLTYDAAAHALKLALASPAVDPSSVIASASDPTLIFDTPQTSADGKSILLPLRDKTRSSEWTKDPVDLTFLTADGSFKISERVSTP
jgi:DsbC/DsbD-like thiol-disulfide interchange protein